MPFGAPATINCRPCPAHELLTLEGKLFVESCDVRIFEGEDARQAVAEFLAGEDLVLEQAS